MILYAVVHHTASPIEVTNLARMHKGLGRPSLDPANTDFNHLDFPTTQRLLLEENYRSTGSILAASLAIVAQGMLPMPHENLVP